MIAAVCVALSFAFSAAPATDAQATGKPVKKYKGTYDPNNPHDNLRVEKKDVLLQEMREDGKAKNPDMWFAEGLKYYTGDGVATDYFQAFDYWHTAAAGDVNCMFALGMMHYQGAGTEKDYAAAMKVWQMAAEKGNAEAQYNLATMYESGLGVEKNVEIARQWYAKAAGNNHAGAIAALKDIAPASQQ